MRRLLWAVLLGAGAWAAPAPAAEMGKFGAGAILGVPFGATAKYWFDGRRAAQAALGSSDGDLTASADLMTNFNDVLPRKRAGRLPLYAGLGLKFKAERRTFIGVRFVGGVSFFHARRPWEFFAEVAPVLRLAPSAGSSMDGGVGVRRYF